MFSTLRTLFAAQAAEAEERLRDANAVTLIDQNIRTSEAGLRQAKTTLATLIQRHRSEQQMADRLSARIKDLTKRTKAALEEGRQDLAEEAAASIASMENEQARRQNTIEQLDARILRLRETVETAHRRIIDLKQGAIAARAARSEQRSQMTLAANTRTQDSMAEADALIKQVLGTDDPFEKSQILTEIDASLSSEDLTDRMADAGLGDQTRSTAASVLQRLKTNF